MLTLVVWCVALRIVCGCGGTWSSFRGTFKSPGYPSVYSGGSSCVYNINSPEPGKKIQIKFDRIVLSYSHNLRVLNSSGDQVARLVGSRGYSTTLASTNYVATFTRPPTGYVHTGFTSSWVECGGEWTEEIGLIQSPYYPSNYHRRADCTYTITPPEGAEYFLTIEDFVVHESDYVTVEYGSEDNAVNLTGSVGVTGFGPANSFNITLKADSTDTQAKGFQMSWQACGGEWTEGSGLIKSPSYPNNYPQGTDCTYTITPPEGSVYILTIEDFDVHASDYVTVECGGLDNPVTLTGSVGVTGFGPVTSFTVTITADTTDTQAKGFQMSWQGFSQGDGAASIHGGLCNVNTLYQQLTPQELTGFYPTIYTAPSVESCMYLCQGRPLCKYFAYSNNVCTTMDSGQGGFCLPTPLYEKV